MSLEARLILPMRRALFLAFLVPAVLPLAGCLERDAGGDPPAGGTPVTSTPPAETDAKVPLRVLESGSMSETSEPVRAVFNDSESWSAFYRAHAKRTFGPDDTAASPRAPDVDFPKERAVAVTLGDKGSSCWAVRVTNATLRGDVTTLTITTYTPPPDMACAAVVTQPYTMVAIPQDGSEVRFEERARPGPAPSP